LCGGTYHGQFKEGQKHGQGTYKFENGDVYSGRRHSVRRSSRVQLSAFRLGDLRPGRDNRFRVKSIRSVVNGLTGSNCFCVGDWCKGQKHGSGTYVYKDGSSLKGEWKEGSLLTGTWTLPSGLRYIGDFKENKPYGEGYWKMPCREGHTVSGKYVHEKISTEDGEEATKGGISLRFVADGM
ncbi:hypothetical protein FOZ63_010819, partial [Perkinsus olseni]